MIGVVIRCWIDLQTRIEGSELATSQLRLRFMSSFDSLKHMKLFHLTDLIMYGIISLLHRKLTIFAVNKLRLVLISYRNKRQRRKTTKTTWWTKLMLEIRKTHMMKVILICIIFKPFCIINSWYHTQQINYECASRDFIMRPAGCEPFMQEKIFKVIINISYNHIYGFFEVKMLKVGSCLFPAKRGQIKLMHLYSHRCHRKRILVHRILSCLQLFGKNTQAHLLNSWMS